MVIVVAASAVVIGVLVATRGDNAGWNAADNVAQCAVAFLAMIACASTARRRSARFRTVWAVLAAGTGLWCLGQIHWSWWEITHNDPPPTPSIEDVAFLGSSLCYVVAVLLLLDGVAVNYSRARALVEGLLITGGLFFLSWAIVMSTVWRESEGVSVLGRIVLLAYPALDVVVIAVLLFALPRVLGTARRWIVPLAIGIAAMAVADSVYACLGALDQYNGVQVNDAGWIIGFLMVALASQRPELVGHAERDVRGQRLLLAVPSLCVLGVVAGAAARQATGATFEPELIWMILAVVALSVVRHLSVIYENHALTNHLAAARDDAIAASTMKSQFLANMSHEIRTPMNAVIGLTALMLDGNLEDEEREYAEGVATSAEGLLGVINDILDFSKIEAGKLTIEEVDLDLDDLVHEVATIVADGARRKGVELVVYCEPGLPTSRRGDPVRLRQILLNLASNAVKFTADGEVIIRAIPCVTPDEVVFEIVDTGIGIPTGEAERLFDPFSQLDSSTTRQFGGTGLGLAIVKQLTELQHGRVEVDSVEGTGTTFRIIVPLPPGIAKPPIEAALEQLRGLHALVVDDNAVNRMVLAHTLTAWGFSVHCAASAADALDVGRTHDRAQPFALIVLDHQMPHMDGIHLAHALRQERTDATPVMVLLSSSPDVSRQAATDAGFDAVLVKPARNSDLLRRILDPLVTRRANNLIPAA
ncbi:MAG: two-component system, sensor histidine kinase and response regulator [Acidimicrobiaceae bacterium]|jgi:signal transduction histidine kinase/CheY-like chemotaxis protein